MATLYLNGTIQCMREHVRAPFQHPDELQEQGWESRSCAATAPSRAILTWDPFPWKSREGLEPARVRVIEVAPDWGLVLEGIALCPDCFVDAMGCGLLE